MCTSSSALVFVKININYIISSLGQDQDELGGSFEKQQSLSGTLSNINIWSKILTDKEVERMSKCFGKYKDRKQDLKDFHSYRLRKNFLMTISTYLFNSYEKRLFSNLVGNVTTELSNNCLTMS